MVVKDVEDIGDNENCSADFTNISEYCSSVILTNRAGPVTSILYCTTALTGAVVHPVLSRIAGGFSLRRAASE